MIKIKPKSFNPQKFIWILILINYTTDLSFDLEHISILYDNIIKVS